ncbi:hypothetical protein LOZ39_002257 [Ophidiomyces ophidiicola]|uniref:Uncharacterized protein n=1 Tax=Ophidiomyces ophidiicola TaxID=1387563 RepID=A0ACB8V214_9EURO|nr:hypothetical protein LOZ64_003992 [Ophidiomyces ophidiicola]KAI1914704.1 hypothetical protein LOZ61_002105 [Ophidiomyces ophidiicola]KAI1930928.1 hypothetical protein LOZ60_000588 [Ophidiomyces ophidiicola]KAI1936076.1 hypothetical protein LOZ62_005808 [Ophidiomyces ophidiicola]KAI2010592.1 hypothetical protein LOZ50_001076 [Ophidiomyces ophidiicola]
MSQNSRTANISTRISLRWPPEPAFENTDTLSLSVGGWYVDLRVDKKSRNIDWAMAGERIVVSEEPSIVDFTHAIDSLNQFDTADRGTFTKLPNGDDLEIGRMPRQDLPGAPIEDYEEVWRDIQLSTGVSWILESEESLQVNSKADGGDRIAKTFLGCVPGHCTTLRQWQWYEGNGQNGEMVSRKRGGMVSARREEWDPARESPIITKHAIGDDLDKLPTLDETKTALKSGVAVGDVVVIGGCRYVVRAFEK